MKPKVTATRKLRSNSKLAVHESVLEASLFMKISTRKITVLLPFLEVSVTVTGLSSSFSDEQIVLKTMISESCMFAKINILGF